MLLNGTYRITRERWGAMPEWAKSPGGRLDTKHFGAMLSQSRGKNPDAFPQL
jgi:hypothetical protein